jgi:hypothetical protein
LFIAIATKYLNEWTFKHLFWEKKNIEKLFSSSYEFKFFFELNTYF